MTHAPELHSVTQLDAALTGRYEIERVLGQGGMATVYLAKDVRHRRSVAVKVLLPELAALVGAERFLREIEIAAGLHHPHILPLHDSGEANGLLYYVMPFVEGESLRGRLVRETQLSIEATVEIAAEVADGLAYAHERGVVHRDIKPENVLLADGHAYIADFGIARAVSAAGGTRLTETGLSLGTPQYMSPEQASGDPNVDGRSDQYALGCVVYEMLVGEPPHTGPSAQAIVAKVLTQPVPRVRETREMVPVQVDLAISRALARLPADRYATVERFAAALTADEAAGTLRSAVTDQIDVDRMVPRTDRRWKLISAVAVVVAMIGVLIGIWGASDGVAPALVYRLELPVEPLAVRDHTSSPSMAISPNGSRLAYVAGESNAGQLYIRHMSSSTPMAIPGAEDAHSPFFSPDGEWVGFVSAGRLRKARVVDGVTQTLGDATELHGASWGRDGWIVLGGTEENQWGLSRIPEDGGDPELLRVPDASIGETYLLWPDVLPSGGVLYTSTGPDGNALGLARLDPETGDNRVLIEGGGTARYVGSGHLVFGKGGSLYAVRFDPHTDEVAGQPIAVIEDLEDAIVSEPSLSHFSVSHNGTLVYLAGSSGASSEVIIVDRRGEVSEVLGPLDERVPRIFGPRVSPDGAQLVFWSPDPAAEVGAVATGTLWRWDLRRGGLSRITRSGADFWSTWLPSGSGVLSTHWPPGEGTTPIVQRRADVPGALTPLVTAEDIGQPWAQPYSVSSDGSTLLFHGSDQGQNFNIYWLSLGDEGTVNRFLDGPDNEAQPAISPDGRWIAFVTDESGEEEVYLADFPGYSSRVQLSVNGGIAPAWAPSGREVFFMTEQDHRPVLVAVPIRTDPELTVGAPEVLFAGYFESFDMLFGRQYDVLPTGEGFVLVRPAVGETPVDRLTTILNWTAELSR